jgi:hypothetical protein
MSLPSVYQIYRQKAFPGKVLWELTYIFPPDEWLGRFPLHVQETYMATGMLEGWLKHDHLDSEVYHLGCRTCKQAAQISVTGEGLWHIPSLRAEAEHKLQQEMMTFCPHLKGFLGEEDESSPW